MRTLILSGFIAAVIGTATLLHLRSHRTPSLVLVTDLDYGQAVAKMYTAKTGIPIRVLDLPPRALITRLKDAGHHPDWTLVWLSSNTTADTLDRAHLLAHALPSPPNLTAVGRLMLPHNGVYVPTGFILGAALVSIKQEGFTPPPTWRDLVLPAYRGIIGITDPSVSDTTYPAFVSVLQSTGGWQKSKLFLKTLRKDGLHIYANIQTTFAALRSGAIKAAIVPFSSAVYNADQINRNLVVTFPAPFYLLPNVISMARGLPAKLRHNARSFITYVNSRFAQTVRMSLDSGNSYYWPVVSGIAPRSGMPHLNLRDASPLHSAFWSRAQHTVATWFSQKMIHTGV